MYRTLRQKIIDNIDQKEVLILLGPRQVGKTTILKNLFKDKAIYIDLDDKVYRDFFDSLSIVKYKSYIDSNLGAINNPIKDRIILILDESQRLKEPGLCAKIFFDEIENVKLILTGSSTLDIRKRTTESLAGRKKTFYLFPLSFQEFLVQKEILKEKDISNFDVNSEKDELNELLSNQMEEHLMERMRIGLYPGILKSRAEEYIDELIESVVLKDIFYMNLVKNTSGLIELLKFLAYTIDEPINVSDISKRLGIARQTVNDYIEILEKSYLIFSINPYSGTREDEISKYSKIYFYDLGIRNGLINDFRPVNTRQDFNAIFKNFIISEIKKLNSYYDLRYKLYYWKTTQGSQTDLVLIKDNTVTGININLYKEIFSKGFENTYPDSKKLVITLNNYYKFII